MEDYINLYHQKLWEIAFSNVVTVYLKYLPIILIVLVFVIYVYISLGLLFKKMKQILLMAFMPLILFFVAIGAEAIYSYGKIMNPNSSENSLMDYAIKYKTVMPILERVDLLTLASVDGELKRDDILFFAVSNPAYYDTLFSYDGLYGDPADSFSDRRVVGKVFPIVVLDYEEKNGFWQSADIRIAPGDEEKDFQEFSKVLHIKGDESERASRLLYNLSNIYEMENERRPKNN